MTEEKDLEQVPDTSGIDVVEGERLQESSVEETAVLEPVTSDEEAAEGAGEEEPEKKRGRVLPFLLSHKAAAGGIAAALVVGAIGIGVASLQAADAGTGGVAAEQKADASAKTPAAKTGANSVPGLKAGAVGKPADTATAPDTGAADAVQADGAAAGQAAAADPAAPASEGDSQTSANGGAQANPSSGTASGSKQPSGGSGSSAGSSSGSSASSGGSSSGGSSSSSGSSSKPASKPAHEHDWQPVTDKQWVPNIVTVQAAYDEPIYEYKQICTCGEEFSSGSAAAAHREERMLAGDTSPHSSSTKKVQTGTKHHDAVTEDQGQYETVTTGYKCSCGATK